MLPPGPSYPSAIQFVGFWTRPLAFFETCRRRYGKRFTMRLPFTPPLVILTEPEEIKRIYTAPPDVLHPGEGARLLQRIVGWNSVILLDEDAHLEQRKLMLPAFHGERMDRLTELVERITDEEVAGWAGDRAQALHPRLQALTLEIILRAVFGLDPGPRLDALRERLAALLAFGNRPITMIPPPRSEALNARGERILDRVGPVKGFLTIRNEIDSLVFEQITERRGANAQRDDLLSLLLEARHEDGTPMSDQELRDELMTLLVAGHETTASSLSWAFARLSHAPAVLARLRDEVDRGDGEDYLLATIQETLRHRPVLPNTAPRFVKKPIEVGGWRYEPGVSLVANAYLVHHDPDIYPDPYSFRPERFLDNPPGTYTWIPFGGGRRRCLGMSFAMLEMRIVLASVLRACELQTLDGPPERARRQNITIRPWSGARVALSARERKAVHQPG